MSHVGWVGTTQSSWPKTTTSCPVITLEFIVPVPSLVAPCRPPPSSAGGSMAAQALFHHAFSCPVLLLLNGIAQTFAAIYTFRQPHDC